MPACYLWAVLVVSQIWLAILWQNSDRICHSLEYFMNLHTNLIVSSSEGMQAKDLIPGTKDRVWSLSESQYPGRYSFFSNGLNWMAIKELSTTRTVISLEHMLLLAKNERGCMYVLMYSYVCIPVHLDNSTRINCVICELKKPLLSYLLSQL